MFEQIGLRIAMALNGVSLRREEGQTLVEYALIIATISIGVTGAMFVLRDQIAGVFSTISDSL
jgi:Flp pilus assembly pilin Flp